MINVHYSRLKGCLGAPRLFFASRSLYTRRIFEALNSGRYRNSSILLPNKNSKICEDTRSLNCLRRFSGGKSGFGDKKPGTSGGTGVEPVPNSTTVAGEGPNLASGHVSVTKSSKETAFTDQGATQAEDPGASDTAPVQYNCHELVYDHKQALEYSQRILDDPISDISPEETARFLIPFPNCDLPKIIAKLTRPFRESHTYEAANTMVHLCVERLENEELTKVFDIGEGFNKRAYLLTLHIWILHRRATKEIPEGVLLNRYLFKTFFEVLKDWHIWKKTPGHRLRIEFENTQSHMLKFIFELNKSTEDVTLYPFKLAATIKHLMYENVVADETLDLLVKYVIRQFMHVTNLDRRHFMYSMFLWADVEEICKPARLLKRPMMQLIKYGGYRPNGVEMLTGRESKKLK